MNNEQRLADLERDGFGASYELEGEVIVRCDQCDVVIIQGLPTHETGCPEQAAAARRALNDDEDGLFDDVEEYDPYFPDDEED